MYTIFGDIFEFFGIEGENLNKGDGVVCLVEAK